MEINYLAIGERIKKYRRERKIPQQKLAKLVGISVPHMCNIENGRTKFGLPILVALADALEVRPDLLLYEQINQHGKMRTMILEEIEAQMMGCSEVQIQMLRESFRNEKRLFLQYEEKLRKN